MSWGKRGDATSFTIVLVIEIVLIIFITMAFFTFINDVRDDTLFAKSHASRDIALLMETAQALPGNVEVYYSERKFDVHDFNYRFDQNLVRIYEGGNPGYSISYPYFVDTRWGDNLEEYDFVQPNAFVISKVNDNLIVREHGIISWDAIEFLSCSRETSTKLDKESFVVVVEDQNAVLEEIANYFVGYEGLDFNNKQKGENAISSTTDVVFILSVGDQDIVEVSTPHDAQSAKLGCLLTNSIGRAHTEADLNDVIKTTDASLTENKSGLAVKIVIGEELLLDGQYLGEALIDGLGDYYDE
jgi:hypothetical protein